MKDLGKLTLKFLWKKTGLQIAKSKMYIQDEKKRKDLATIYQNVA